MMNILTTKNTQESSSTTAGDEAETDEIRQVTAAEEKNTDEYIQKMSKLIKAMIETTNKVTVGPPTFETKEKDQAQG